MNQPPLTVNNRAALLQSAIELLLQGEDLLQALDDGSYVRKVECAFNASIGGHYRHCLDHFRNLLQAIEAGDVNYDDRSRGTPIERDRLVALKATLTLRDAFGRLRETCLERELRVVCKTSYALSGSQRALSTVGREIMYVVAHAVHHYALIGLMGGLLGLKLPPGFGVAPSTLDHQAEEMAASAA